jgi:N-carbamoylputrescine amidase
MNSLTKQREIKMTKVNVALIQMTCGEDVQANLDKSVNNIREAAGRGANIICLQELFKSTYFCQIADPQLFNLAEEVDENSPSVKVFRDLAEELGVVLIVGLFEKRAPGVYHNCAVVLDADGSYLGKYRKMHIPEYPHYYEKFYFIPGDLGYKVFETQFGKVGVLICWDQWFPEAARLTALQGAKVIFIPTAIGYIQEGEIDSDPGERVAWEIVQRGHAVANGCYLAAVNRVGFEPDPNGNGGIQFWGSSFISDPYGQITHQASDTEDEILVGEIDLAYVDHVRDVLAQFFRDRRIDSYEELTKRFID